MKKYVIVLFPQKDVSAIIEDFRINKIGEKLVDNLYPHITFKRRFSLNRNFSEQDLINYFNNLSYPKFKVNFINTAVFNDAVVLIGESEKLVVAHKKLVKSLGKNIITDNPEWEMENYKIHLTLLRGPVINKEPPVDIEDPKINQAILDKMALYEIGSGDHANAIASIKLN